MIRALAMRVDSVYICTKNALNIPIMFQSSLQKAEARALIDSGATENFIDY
jgi:hypothetical protein